MRESTANGPSLPQVFIRIQCSVRCSRRKVYRERLLEGFCHKRDLVRLGTAIVVASTRKNSPTRARQPVLLEKTWKRQPSVTAPAPSPTRTLCVHRTQSSFSPLAYLSYEMLGIIYCRQVVAQVLYEMLDTFYCSQAVARVLDGVYPSFKVNRLYVPRVAALYIQQNQRTSGFALAEQRFPLATFHLSVTWAILRCRTSLSLPRLPYFSCCDEKYAADSFRGFSRLLQLTLVQRFILGFVLLLHRALGEIGLDLCPCRHLP